MLQAVFWMRHVWCRLVEKGLLQFRQAVSDETGAEKVVLRLQNNGDGHGSIWGEGFSVVTDK